LRAATAGLRPEDVITKIDGEPATSNLQLQELTLTKKPGDTVSIGYEREVGAIGGIHHPTRDHQQDERGHKVPWPLQVGEVKNDRSGNQKWQHEQRRAILPPS
jgi:C-terminal processing protease CtpA/Prc